MAVETALPPLTMTQDEAFDFIDENFQVRKGTKELYRRILKNPSVQTRSFAMTHPDEVLETDLDKIHLRFKKWAVRLSKEALLKSLEAAGLSPKDLDYIVVTTCTGYLCPGIASYLVEECGLNKNIHFADLVGMGCAAGIPGLEHAYNHLTAHPGSVAAVVSTEICSAAFYSDDSPDLVVSNSIFADGSAAVILKSFTEGEHLNGSAPLHPALSGFASLVEPDWRDFIRFRYENGRLRNMLSKDLPQTAAGGLKILVDDFLAKNKLSRSDIHHWIIHAGGEKVIDAVGESLFLLNGELKSARTTLKNHGNLSSPTVFFVLKEELASHEPQKGEVGLMVSFGAGFSAHLALLDFS
ncbi:MAG: type III polyketide synthase [Elusimicrobia bacterium]|nr:type III polyketide synthase [Candidatus Obscuribacterium magneticum]